MSQVTLPLPNRSLAIGKRPFSMPAAFLFSVVVLSAMAIGLGIWQGPGLWRDWQINQNPLTLDDWDMSDGECSSRRGLTDCEADITYSYEGRDYAKHISLAFLDFSSDDYMVDVVISRNDPELATLSLGLDMLWNRLAVFGVFMLLFGGGAIGMIINALRAMGANRAAAVPGRLTLVPVEIAELKKVPGGMAVSYIDHLKGRSKRTTRTHFAKGQEPLIGLDETGKQVGVAVKLDHVAIPVLLDRNLERVELTDIERQAALAAFDAEQEQRGAKLAANPPPKAKRGPNIVRGLLAGGAVLVLAVVAFFGFWLYYVTTAPDAFDAIGIEINNIMPEPLNTWGCEQLYARFGDGNAPYGCTADDYVSWKVAKTASKVK
ncbi:hypothetical protein ASD83_09820 [Devosia sp. Root685]|uniref:hypothetical protein n=1 Tax=Devosia sp. Root685 TaxID=1736587 RepID=UPI0006FECBE1|nr:hypothetical protein [Devosia sp. Root685]KRA97424.1 hypothetical protein ASD83_09820 [Devosia sp. Root685]